MSLLEFWCASRVFFLFLCFLSPPCNLWKKMRDNKVKKIKRSQWRIKTPVMTQLVPLERSRWDESSDIKEGHQWWLKYTTQAVRRQISPNIFDWLVWPTPVTVYNLPWCRWIRPVDIFPTISVVSLSELRCVSMVFFFLPLFFFLFSLLSFLSWL